MFIRYSPSTSHRNRGHTQTRGRNLGRPRNAGIVAEFWQGYDPRNVSGVFAEFWQGYDPRNASEILAEVYQGCVLV